MLAPEKRPSDAIRVATECLLFCRSTDGKLPEQKLITPGISGCLLVTFGIRAGDISSSWTMVDSRKT